MAATTFRARLKTTIIYALTGPQLRHLDDERYLKFLYWLRLGKSLNLEHPTTFNEKLQWLKLNYRDSSTYFLVDKLEVKAWVASRIGSEHVIPTLNVYDSAEEIDFDALPDAFVLKTTHDSGGVVVVPDKSALDIARAREALRRSLRRNLYYASR